MWFFTKIKEVENIPCKIQAYYEHWIKKGNKGQFSCMISCKCPKCTPYTL